MEKMLMSNSGGNYGVIGRNTGFKNFEVGDLVVAGFDSEDRFSGVIVETGGDFYIMGACGKPLNSFSHTYKVLHNSLVTEEIVRRMHGFKIVEPKKITVAEIEKILGYPVEITGLGR